MSFSKLGPPQIPPTKWYPEFIYIRFKVQDARVGEGKVKIRRSKLQKLSWRLRFAKWKMWFLSLTPFSYYKTSKDFNEIYTFIGLFFPLVIAMPDEGVGKEKITQSNLQKLSSRSRFAEWKMWFLNLEPFPHYKISTNFNEIFHNYWAFLPSSDSNAWWGGKKGKKHAIHSATLTLTFKLLRW